MWFFRRDGANQGPISEAEFRALITSGELGPDSYVWQQGWPEWKRLRDCEAPIQPPPIQPPPMQAPPMQAPPNPLAPAEDSKNKRQKIFIAVCLVICVITFGSVAKKNSSSSSKDRGVRWTHEKCEIYQGVGVTEQEAKALLDIFIQEANCSDNKKSFEVKRDGARVQFRMVTKKDRIHDPAFKDTITLFMNQLSEQIFNGEPVDVDLCDPYFKTVRHVKFQKMEKPSSYGTKKTHKKCEVFHAPNITDQEIQELFKVIDSACSDTVKSVQLKRADGRVLFRMVIKSHLVNAPEYHKDVRAFMNNLSKKVFHNEAVDAHLCDENFKTLRVISFDRAKVDPKATDEARKSVEKKGCEVVFDDPALRGTAEAVLAQLVNEGGCNGTPKTFAVDKTKNGFIFKMVTKEELRNKRSFHIKFRGFLSALQRDAFGGSALLGDICDRNLKPVHSLPPYDRVDRNKCFFYFDRSISKTMRTGLQNWLVPQGCSTRKDYFLLDNEGLLEFGLVVTAYSQENREIFARELPDLKRSLGSKKTVVIRVFDVDYETLGVIR